MSIPSGAYTAFVLAFLGFVIVFAIADWTGRRPS